MVRAVLRKDFPHIAKFLNLYSDQHFPEEKYLRDFLFWWDENPSFKNGDQFGWIIEDKNRMDYVKGFLGNIPCEYEINDQTITTYNPSTWYVHPDYRHEALFLALAFNEQGDTFYVNSTPSLFTEQIFLKLKYTDRALKHKSYIKIISGNTIRYFFVKKGLPVFLTNLISVCSVIFLKCFELFHTTNKKVTIQSISDLCGFKSNKEKLYIKHLDWVLKDKNKKAFSISINNGKQQEYLIIQLVDNKMNGLRYIQILDYSESLTLESLCMASDQIIKQVSGRIDYILISNVSNNKKIDHTFIDISSQLKPVCLIKSKMILNNTFITSMLGEKGFVLWS